ncbi:MAG: hypothetical protein LPK19_07605, partial [Hymenobacteraceae bacterium]|nr:hypothetical protein [Hymenobacteraceae bacterium]MDX5396073.1 hypothetical protein [Hymenobacteraceae bacterium]MDX5512138.1 hypothetical protein [Hymenobacteraceae bacterium]
MLILYLPVLLLCAVFHPALWPVYLIFMVLQVIGLMLAITTKYSSYSPNASLSANSVLLFLSQLGLLLPFLLPLPLVLLIRNYRRAVYNLSFYLYD